MARRKRMPYVRLNAAQLREVVRNTPIRHESLPPEDLAVCAYTYRKVGKFVTPTLEQWELGFMKDTNPMDELAFWLRLTILIDKLQPADPKLLVMEVVGRSVGNPMSPETEQAWRGITPDECDAAICAALSEVES